MAREKAQGRESVVATEPQEHKCKELDPGFRRDDEVRGFRRDDEAEAFAGMTKVGTFTGMTKVVTFAEMTK